MQTKRLSYKLISIIIVILHLVTVSYVEDVFAYKGTSVTCNIISGSLTGGGNVRTGATVDIQQDSIGEFVAGKIEGTTCTLYSGYIYTINSNPPIQTQIIPNQTWPENQSKQNAFDLDDYFTSDAGLLSYTVTGNINIIVLIDAVTHVVSFSQAQAWFGTETIQFIAADTESNTTISNEISLQVQGVNNPPVLDFIPDITVQETGLVQITPHATDLDGDAITYSYTLPLDSTGKWQTDYTSAGTYNITVTARDTTNLTDTQIVKVTVTNKNRAPILQSIPAITKNECELVTVTPVASDPDNDAISIYYSTPLDTTGKWQTDYEDSGTYTCNVTASDGIDNVTTQVNITINNANRSPEAILSLDKYTANPNDNITITLLANDLDGDAMTFNIKKDGNIISSGSITDSFTTNTSFSGMGAHTISAVVTDSKSGSVTVSKGIDVVDPNINRDAINPVMGDFNGDALSDLGLHNSDTGGWEICIAKKGGIFENAVIWLSSFGTSKDFWPMSGDFNGDSKTDIGIYNNTTGQFQVAFSTGTGFSTQGVWLTFSNANYSWQAFTGNFNADKYTDFGVYNRDTGEVRISLGTGTGFSGFTTWLNNSDTNYALTSGDYNGDGVGDICLYKKASGEYKVIFSNTKSFVDGSIWKSGYGIDKDPLVSDFNNDGLTDIGYWDKNNFNWNYAISKGNAFVDKGLLLNYGSTSDESVTTGDFNGDGITDYAAFDKDSIGILRWKTKLSDLKHTDLLNEINNGIGGKTQVTYTYASQFDNDLLPFPVYVASSISLINTYPSDRQATYTQNFTYSGGYYDAGEREFRGFNKVKAIDPITNNYTETYFYQGKPNEDAALKGQIQKITAYDGNNKKTSETINVYEVKKGGAGANSLGFPSLKDTTTTIWEENSSHITSSASFVYDNIGNVLETTNDIGSVYDSNDLVIDTAVGDEKSTLTSYTMAYDKGFNRPEQVLLKDKDANIVSKKSYEYDEYGNLLKEKAWLYNPLTLSEQDISANYTYDSFGNNLTSTNAKGGTVTTTYETTYYTYPKEVTNSLGHKIQYTYDAKFGAVTQTIDPNRVISSTEYDSLSRVTRVTRDDGGGTKILGTYTYPDFNTKITTNAIGLSATEYIDGLGRKYKTVSQGEDGQLARNISSEVYYNNRALVDKESLSHYIDEDVSQISYAKYEYDIRGRIKKTIQDYPGTEKDTESSINYITPLYTETIDPLGHKKGAKKDVYGKVLKIIEFTQGGVYNTNYEYDAQDNLTKTIDNNSNTTQLYYDSFGRKLKMIDPDMGTWTYEYDELGNLVKQTDAKNQILQFEYDVLNRLVRKSTVNGPQSTVYTYDELSKPNCIGRLSKISDSSGGTEFFYDKLGREIKSTKSLRGAVGDEAISYTVERIYDILDRLTTLTYPDNTVVNYTYDTNSGLLERVFTSTTQYVQDITYNAKGQIKVIKYGNGVQTNYTYGNDLRLSRILTQGTSALQDLNYLFDKNGNVTTLTDNLRSNIRTYTYDNLDRLMEARNIPNAQGGYTTHNFQYDCIGNMTYKSDIGIMSYGITAGPHALTNAGGYTYNYDANGNMTINRGKALEYDAENRLTKVTENGTITTFTYDGDGGRVRRTTDDGRGTIQSTTYIGSLFEIQSTANSPQTTVKHIFAGANRICTVDSGPSTADYRYYHSDHLGSSNIIIDATGAQVQHCEYAPYGTITKTEGEDVVSHKFTGKELDNTGLYFYGARYYDPVIGRFITADTIVQAPYNPQTLNRYSYCSNNPLNYVDPTGHWSWKKFFKTVGIAIAGIALTIVSGGVLTPLIGAYWTGVVTGGLIGSTIGGSFAAATGGNIGMGLLTGFVGGAVFAGLAPGLATLSQGFFRGMSLGPGVSGPLTSGWSMASNFTSNFLAGGFSGAAVAGMTGADVGRTALMGGAIAGGFSLGRDTALWMRAKMVNQSRLDPRNASGKSVGFDGDKFKLGGGRYDPVHPNGNPSPLGGAQGGVGQIFGVRYNPGSLGDRIVEIYAGPHDYLNSWGYDLFGNLKNQSGFEGFLGATLNPLNVVVVTPLAVSSAVPREAYAAPAITYGQNKENETR